jgi:hypothetical protein
MTLPASGSPLSFSQIATEWGKNPAFAVSLDTYHKGAEGAGPVTNLDIAPNVPSTPGTQINVSDFYSATHRGVMTVAGSISGQGTGIGTYTGSAYLHPDGTITGTLYSGTANWYTLTTGGIGNSYWVKFTVTGGSAYNAGLIPGTLYQLNVDRGVQYSATAGNTKAGNVGISIYSDSGGTVLVGSGGFSASLDNT